ADGWWDVATKLTGVAKTNIQNHAVEIYKTLDVKGLDRAKVDQRIAEADAIGLDPVTCKTISLMKTQPTKLKMTQPGSTWSGVFIFEPNGKVGNDSWSITRNKLIIKRRDYSDEFIINGVDIKGRGRIDANNPNGKHDLLLTPG
ncbi:MAG: hypothetical protein WCJ97_09300, partial [Phycisphaerae bacterium]